MIGFLGGYEWLVVLVIALLLFGHRIPGMARSLGSGITEFKKGLRSTDEKDETKQVPPASTGTSNPAETQRTRTE
ncbi:MAG: twin-arginine translocase TatA/TatE family subunit [Planctomycetes bacterium]|nr:twin-arginine translocase TatA/TatE family subunit [Planctomycetota bacterium]